MRQATTAESGLDSLEKIKEILSYAIYHLDKETFLDDQNSENLRIQKITELQAIYEELTDFVSKLKSNIGITTGAKKKRVKVEDAMDVEKSYQINYEK